MRENIAVEVAESQPTAAATVRLQTGGTVRIAAITSDSGEHLAKAGVEFKRLDSSWPSLSLQPRKEGNTFVFEHVPPAKYRVSALQYARAYDQLQYETKDAQELIVEPGAMLDVKLTLQGRSLTKKEQDQRAPWIATGRVTDKDGHPLEGVEIWGSAGWGSLYSGKFATTDKDGRYYGRFGSSGIQFVDWEADPLGLVSAQVGAHKAGMAEANINRHGGLLAANRLPKPGEKLFVKDADPGKLFIRGQPREINFVLVPAVQATVQLQDAHGKPLTTGVTLSGHELPPASSAYQSAKVDANQQFAFDEIPPTYSWWFETRIEPRRSVRTVPFKFPAEPNKYHLVLRHQVEELTGFDRLNVVSATDAAGNDVKARILADDKYLRPPVESALQEKGREILRKVREVNRYWLIGPPPEVKEYSYQFKLLDRETRQVNVLKPMFGSIYERRGISFYSAFDYITAQPDKVIFRVVDVGESQIELVYALKEVARVSAGNGVAGSWAGYFSMGVREGTLIIDPKTHTLIEHRTSELTEKLSKYTEIRPGYYVPLRIQVSKMDFDWTFKVHQPGLWLFDKAALQEQKRPGTVEVTNVVVQTAGEKN